MASTIRCSWPKPGVPMRQFLWGHWRSFRVNLFSIDLLPKGIRNTTNGSGIYSCLISKKLVCSSLLHLTAAVDTAYMGSEEMGMFCLSKQKEIDRQHHSFFYTHMPNELVFTIHHLGMYITLAIWILSGRITVQNLTQTKFTWTTGLGCISSVLHL